jgi:pentatricopeptide repeat protein
MQLHGRRGNYERILELKERMPEWNIEENAGVYDYLIHAYCKAGLMNKAKDTFLKFEKVNKVCMGLPK